MKKAVLDSNVIVSALIFGGTPGKVFDLAIEDEIANFTSEDIITEVKRTLTCKFSWKPVDTEKAARILSFFSRVVTIKQRFDIVSEDSDDNKIIECAVAGKADFIVTGDKHLLKLKKFRRTAILTPADFLKAFEK